VPHILGEELAMKPVAREPAANMMTGSGGKGVKSTRRGAKKNSALKRTRFNVNL